MFKYIKNIKYTDFSVCLRFYIDSFYRQLTLKPTCLMQECLGGGKKRHKCSETTINYKIHRILNEK